MAAKGSILVLGKVHEAGLDKLRAHGFDIVERADNPADLLSVVEHVDAIIVRTTPIGDHVLHKAPRLKLVARHGVGYDAVDVPALTAKGIPLALIGDVNSTAVAEHTLALALDTAKCLTAYDQAVRAGDFCIRDRFNAVELEGRIALVIGLGRIGSKVAKLFQAFGMNVAGFDPYADRAKVERLGVRLLDDWRLALEEADFVTIHVPKLPGTQHLIGVPELAKMKPGSVLINVSRGGLVDEAALCNAVGSGHLRGAGIDVFESEPLSSSHPFVREPRIILSPHSAAFTQECVRRMSVACADNVIAAGMGALDPELVVNKEVLGAASQRGWEMRRPG